MGKIAAAIIAYNAEIKIQDLLKSLVGQVDYLVVGIDQKTTDKTEEIVKSFQFEKIITFPFELWRDGAEDFSQARQQTFDRVPEDTDWILWIDTDDILVGDLRAVVADAGDNCSMIWLDYSYFFDQYGNVTTTFIRERLLRKKFNPKWIGRGHETCQVSPGGTWHTNEKRVKVEHRNRTEEGKSERNFRFLKKSIEEDPNDHRAILYMGHQHFAAHNWQEAAEWYLAFTELKSPGDVREEKWQALVMAAKALRSLGDLKNSINVATRALLMCPQYSDSHFELSATYAVRGDWQKCIYWFEEGMAKNLAGDDLHRPPHSILIHNPLDYNYNPFVSVHVAYYSVGKIRDALACVQQALAIRPQEAVLKTAEAVYLWRLQRDEAIDAQTQLAKYLAANNEPLKALDIMSALPAGADQDNSGVDKARKEISTLVAHLYDETDYENFLAQNRETEKVEDLLKEEKEYPHHKWIIEQVKKLGANRVLDVGVGNGYLAFQLARLGVKVVGIDADPRRCKEGNWAAVRLGMLGFIRKKFDTKKTKFRPRVPDILPSSKIQFHYGRVEAIPEKVKNLGPYDAIICSNVLNLIADPGMAVKELEQFGVPVIIITPDGAAPQTHLPGTVRTWSRTELERLFWERGQTLESHFLAEDESQLGFVYIPKIDIRERPPVVIYCGAGIEPWDSDQIDAKGLGGSETAVVKVARELVKKGARVMVYAEAEGIWDGAFYRHYSKWDPRNPVWLTIFWRRPEVLDIEKDVEINSELKWLWMHDTDHGPNITEERMKKVDTVMALSNWHINHLTKTYPFLAGKVIKVGNGIDPWRFDKSKRNPKRMIYASSPDRGLDRALAYFPEIRKEIPDAELHIFYGWHNFDRMGGPQNFKAKIIRMAEQPGVFWHDRVGQAQMAKEYEKSGILLYPSHEFNETYCITVVEAQAGGCVPITRDNGALRETNQYGMLLSTDKATITDYINAIKWAIGLSEEDRQPMIEWAKQQTWTSVANRIIDRAREITKTRELVEA